MIARGEPRETGSTADTRRLHYLDWLRMLALWMVFLFHAGHPFDFSDSIFSDFNLLLLRFPGFSPSRPGYGDHLWFLVFIFFFALITLPFLLWSKKTPGQRYLVFSVVQWETGIGVKLPVVVLRSFFVSITLHELIVRRIPIFRVAFGMKPKCLQNV